jgi:hypothetical protein
VEQRKNAHTARNELTPNEIGLLKPNLQRPILCRATQHLERHGLRLHGSSERLKRLG